MFRPFALLTSHSVIFIFAQHANNASLYLHRSAGTMIGFMAAFDGCRRILSPSRYIRFRVASVRHLRHDISPSREVLVFSTIT